jgi:curved DNA-binding protein CbpA
VSDNPYKVLGLKECCSTDQVRAAYRRQSKTAHPDKGGSPEDFRRLQWAHDVLTDEDRREWWDTHEWDRGDRAKLEQAASQMLANLLRQVLASDNDPFAVDLVKVLREHIRKEVDGAEKNVRMLERGAARAEVMRQRFSTTLDKSMVDTILELEQQQIDQHLRQNWYSIAVWEHLRDTLAAYKFQWDQPVQIHSYYANTHGSASTNAAPTFAFRTR